MRNTLVGILLLVSHCYAFSQKAEVVFCVDLSTSANGVLQNIHSTVFSVVNDLDAANKYDEVQFGFIGTGRQSYTKERGYTRVVSDLRSDINALAGDLFKIPKRVEGCDFSYVTVLERGLYNISWSKEKDVTKLMFIIGNGSIDSKKIRKLYGKAKKKNIKIVNIYFNNKMKMAEENSWRKFSRAMGVSFKVSNNNYKRPVFTKTYDDLFIQQAGQKLLGTYLYYSVDGLKNFKRLKSNYEKIKELGPTAFEEMLVYQSSYHVQGKYKKWDLVDLYSSGKIDCSKIERQYLPKFLRNMDDEKLALYLKIKAKQRKLLVDKIRLELASRKAYKSNKLEKSKHFVGKGGLQNIIQSYIEDIYAANVSKATVTVATSN